MPDIGFLELLLIGIVALVVLGPDKLPGAVRSAAKTIRTIKATVGGIKSDVSEQLRIHELHENLRKAEQMGMKDLPANVQASVDELNQLANSVQPPASQAKDGKQPNSD